MLPVTAGPAATRKQILVYSVLLALSALLLLAVSHLGVVYAAAAVGLGSVFVWKALKLYRHPESTSPMDLYKYSLLYLAALFVVMGVDVAIGR